jgi:RNA polymerase sigma factor (sigma-70 family)
MTTEERDALNAAMRRLAGGDRSAARPVFERLWPVLRALCARTLGDAARGEDVAQQAIVKLFDQASGFDPARDALAWAVEIAALELRTERRRRQRSREEAPEAPIEMASTAEPADERLAAAELAESLSLALATLTPADRLTLAEAVSESQPAVAGATWRKRKERALTRLRQT